MSERNKPILRLVLVCLLSLLYSSLITHHSLLSLHSSLPAGKPNEPTFLVHTADGSDPRGTLRKLAEDWSVRLGGAKPALVAGTDLISLRRSEVPLPAYPNKDVLLFANGDRLPFDPRGPVQLDDDQLRIQPAPPWRARGDEIK